MPHRKNQSRKRGLGSQKRRTAERKALKSLSRTYGTIDIRGGVPAGLKHCSEPRIQPLARKLGIRFYPAVIDIVQYKSKHWGAVKRGIVITASDEPFLLQALREREARNTEAIRQRRREARARADAKFTKQFATKVRERFPGMPEDLEHAIAEHATKKGTGRVGRSKTADDPIWLAVNAHVRWNFTDYAARLEESFSHFRSMDRWEKRATQDLGITPKDDAIRAVDGLVHDILDTWEGKPPQDSKRRTRVANALGIAARNEALNGASLC